jgi:argininosuccinate lyase
MENTGRIRKLLMPAARRILFGGTTSHSEDELRHMSYVDEAHLVMLSECGIIGREPAARLCRAIDCLRAENFRPLHQKEPTRGLFLLYEDYLIATQGAQVGGTLQTARSRNDLNATVLKLRLRRPFLRVLGNGIRFHAVLLRRAKKYADIVMPAYTHGQVAMPVTYGHYLAGVAAALMRDLAAWCELLKDLQSCPLGAGAVAGTSFPIDTQRTARLLGFDSGPLHSLDAVASRDIVLRLLASGAIYAMTLSRVATDLVQWTTAEFDFLRLPDELVGSSSAMPQKRNPFLLEHVQGRAASLAGAFMQSFTAMHAAPFTNSIAVGTEAVRPLWRALEDLTEMMILIRLVIANAVPNREAMLRRTAEGFSTATALADHLVRESSLDFRTAHRLVGEAVLASLQDGSKKFEDVAAAYVVERGLQVSFHDLDSTSVVRSLEFGGGPGNASLQHCLRELKAKWMKQYAVKRRHEKHWCEAETMRMAAIERLTHPAFVAETIATTG